MTKNDLLKETAKHHLEWIKVIKAHSFNKTECAYAEDFVQEAYIKLHTYADPERVAPNGVLNKGYFFFVLKSVLFDYRKAKTPIKISIEDCETCDDQQEQKGIHKTPDYLFEKMYQTIDGFNWYDKKLFEIYLQEIPSIRKLAKETRISQTEIFNTLKKAKDEINRQLNKDYKAFKESA
jgi:RNA polymerase sigma factor (sigma-70 family)